MLKLRHIILIFLMLVVQHVFAAHSDEFEASYAEDLTVELSFEVNDAHPGIWGDIPSGQSGVNLLPIITELYPGISKSKDILSGLSYSVSGDNLKFLLAQSSIFTKSSAVYIPIYVQTASFLI